jgi:predicted transcriptional regulator
MWALKVLRDEPLELFAAAAKWEARTIEEIGEPAGRRVHDIRRRSR